MTFIAVWMCVCVWMCAREHVFSDQEPLQSSSTAVESFSLVAYNLELSSAFGFVLFFMILNLRREYASCVLESPRT